jgi:hypothetical protein
VVKRIDDNLRAWALIGAEQRLVQLAEEAAAIHRLFPELRQRGGSSARANVEGGAETARVAPRKRGPGRPPKRRMSADARRRISEAQKARWAKQRSAGMKKR